MIAIVNGKFGYGRIMQKHDDHDKICRRVAELLSAEREDNNMSMTQLAADAGLAQSAVSFFENHHRSPTFKTLLRLSDTLEVDLGRTISRAIKDVRGGKSPD